MFRLTVKNLAALIGIFALVWLGIQYLLPIVLPFLLGGALALAAEPAVRLLHSRLHLPRGAAAGIGVSLTLVLLCCLLLLLGAVLVRQIGSLAGALPDLEQTARSGLVALEDFLLSLTARAPGSIGTLLNRTVTNLFSGSSALVDRLAQQLPSLASSFLGHVPGSALSIGTGLLAAFMVSARFPAIKAWLQQLPLSEKLRRYGPVLRNMRTAIGGWVRAQLRLSGMSLLIVLTGMFLLRISNAPLWALLTALVDAIPVLGTGTVLIPWALICLLQGEYIRAVGLMGTYIVAFIARSALEPRLVGKQLGLDPLTTLAALYAGYRIWGFAGMLLSPILCVAAAELIKAKQ